MNPLIVIAWLGFQMFLELCNILSIVATWHCNIGTRIARQAGIAGVQSHNYSLSTSTNADSCTRNIWVNIMTQAIFPDDDEWS